MSIGPAGHATPSGYCLITFAYPQGSGANRSGWGSYAEMLHRCLRTAGIPVTVVVVDNDEPPGILGPVADGDVHVVRLPYVRYVSWVARWLVEGVYLLQVIRRLDATHHFAVIEGPNVTGTCWAVAAWFRSRFVLRVHTSLTQRPARIRSWHDWQKTFRQWLDGWTARRAGRVVTHSRAHAVTTAHDYRVPVDEITIIPHAIADPGPSRPGDAQRILVIANATPRKGVDILLAAFGRVRQLHPRAELRLVGCRDADVDRLLPAPHSADARAGIAALGPLSDDDLADEWDRAGTVVVCSRYESFGLVAVEAMARGKTLVSTDGGALSEVIGPGGMVVASNDPEALFSAMHTMLSDEGLRASLAAIARTRYLELYQPGLVTRRVVELIASIAGPVSHAN